MSVRLEKAWDQFLERQNTVPRRIAFIGDDLPDLVILGCSGLSFAPADAVPEVRTVVHRVLESAGGAGALRDRGRKGAAPRRAER